MMFLSSIRKILVFILLSLVALGCTTTVPTATSHSEPPLSTIQIQPEHIEPFLYSYFNSWNQKDWEAYASHFHHSARIQYTDNNQILSDLNKEEFIAQQQSVSKGIERTETMQSYTIRDDRKVEVKWKLVKGEHVTRGINEFTFVPSDTHKHGFSTIQLRWHVVT